MKKKIIIISIITITFLGCKSNENSSDNSQNNISARTREAIEIQKKIKKRTKQALNKLGISKVLLYKKGEWQSGCCTKLFFKKNFKLLWYFNGVLSKEMEWKIVEGKLYIFPNFEGAIEEPVNKKFYLMEIKAIQPRSHTIGPENNPNKYLKAMKYAIEIKSKKKEQNDTGPLIIYSLVAYKEQ